MKISKNWFIVLFLVILGIILYFSIPYFYYSYQSWKIGRAYKQFEQGFLDYLRKDTYGGKTPQETYEMYIEALKDGDLDSASQYYWWEKQVKEKERLEKLKEEGKFEEYVESLPKWEEMIEEEYWDPEGRRYGYVYTLEKDETFYDELMKEWDIIPAGEYKGDITFQFNKHANIWKLY